MQAKHIHEYETLPGGVCAPQGWRASGVSCGIKKPGLRDLALLVSDTPASGAALYTSNRFRAAPIQIMREQLADGVLQAVVINSGNANACTGERGLEAARRVAAIAARALGLAPANVGVASTGVIGSPLPVDRIESGIRDAAGKLREEGGEAAEAILTTDTFTKQTAIACMVGGESCIIGGMAKGAGMIRPDLATMLAFLTTDARVRPETLQACLKEAVERSFNLISVDGCMSTNDMVLALANGEGSAEVLDANEVSEFTAALSFVCCELAKLIVKDGEGATKFVTVRVESAGDFSEAKTAALGVADSNLVKTALFGGDPNWGRIAAALGAAGIDLDPGSVDIRLGPYTVVTGGEPQPYDEEQLASYMREDELEIVVALNRGNGQAAVWTSDLSYDYVRINADYRS